MSSRDKSYHKPHRAAEKALARVRDQQAEARGEGLQWKEADSANRHERRRFVRGTRAYDKLHGEGAAAAYIKEHGLEGEALVSSFVGRADREGAGGSSQDDSSRRGNNQF